MVSSLSQFLLEALSDEQKEVVDGWGPADKARALSQHVFQGDRHEVPLQARGDDVGHPAVVAHLKHHGYTVSDWARGTAIEPKYRREVRIGRALTATGAPEHLMHLFNTDPQRATGRLHDDLKVVISRHPHDIAGMSTGRSWTSCMSMSGYDQHGEEDEGGENQHYLPRDIAHGTHVAYLTKKDDHDIENPLSRIALKPFTSQHGHTILVPERRSYGNDSKPFDHTVAKWAQDNFPMHPGHYYKPNPELYNDTRMRGVMDWSKFDPKRDHQVIASAVKEGAHSGMTIAHHIASAGGKVVVDHMFDHHMDHPPVVAAVAQFGDETQRQAAVASPVGMSRHVWASAIAGNPQWAKRARRESGITGDYYDHRVELAIAEHGDDDDHHWLLAQGEKPIDAVHAALYTHGSEQVRSKVMDHLVDNAHHQRATTAVATHGSDADVMRLADKYNISGLFHEQALARRSPAIDAHYVNNADPALRRVAAKKASNAARETLLHDPDDSVRRTLAQYGTHKMRDHLANDVDMSVRKNVVQYGADSHRDKLMADPHAAVRGMVAIFSKTHALKMADSERDLTVRESIVPHLPAEQLKGFYRPDDWNPNIHHRTVASAILGRVLDTPDHASAKHIIDTAPDSNHTTNIIMNRTPKMSAEVQLHVAKKYKTNLAVRSALTQSAKSPEVLKSLLANATESELAQMRFYAPRQHLKALGDDYGNHPKLAPHDKAWWNSYHPKA